MLDAELHYSRIISPRFACDLRMSHECASTGVDPLPRCVHAYLSLVLILILTEFACNVAAFRILPLGYVRIDIRLQDECGEGGAGVGLYSSHKVPGQRGQDDSMIEAPLFLGGEVYKSHKGCSIRWSRASWASLYRSLVQPWLKFLFTGSTPALP